MAVEWVPVSLCLPGRNLSLGPSRLAAVQEAEEPGFPDMAVEWQELSPCPSPITVFR